MGRFKSRFESDKNSDKFFEHDSNQKIKKLKTNICLKNNNNSIKKLKSFNKFNTDYNIKVDLSNIESYRGKKMTLSTIYSRNSNDKKLLSVSPKRSRKKTLIKDEINNILKDSEKVINIIQKGDTEKDYQSLIDCQDNELKKMIKKEEHQYNKSKIKYTSEINNKIYLESIQDKEKLSLSDKKINAFRDRSPNKKLLIDSNYKFTDKRKKIGIESFESKNNSYLQNNNQAKINLEEIKLKEYYNDIILRKNISDNKLLKKLIVILISKIKMIQI